MNVFEKTDQHKSFSWEDTGNIAEGRVNLGEDMPVIVYRLFQYTMRDILIGMLGKDGMVEAFRRAGEIAGREFALHQLDLSLEWDALVAQLQSVLRQLKIGVLRMEEFDRTTGHAVLTISEDLDCSGLPVSGEAVCHYDEGLLAGILSTYSGHAYMVREVDCWATGDRVCRFDAQLIAE